MLEAPAHIQRMLAETFPGLELVFNERTGYWVLVDELFRVDGSVDYNAAYPPPGGLCGIEPYPLTRRKLIWVLGNPENFERWEPCADLILNALYHAHNGGRLDAIEQWIDEVEQSEDREEQRGKKDERERARDKAGEIYDRVKIGRATFSREHASTPWKTDRALERKYREEAAATAAVDAEADRRIRNGSTALGSARWLGKT